MYQLIKWINNINQGILDLHFCKPIFNQFKLSYIVSNVWNADCSMTLPYL